MKFRKLAARMVMSRIEHINNTDIAESALDQLVAGGRGFDIRDVVSRLQRSGGEIAKLTRTWLDDGDNAPISGLQIHKVFGARQLDRFARKLGMERHEACQSLATILPLLVDQASQQGQLLGSIERKGLFSGLSSRLLRKTG